MLTRAELGLALGDFAVLSIGDLNRNKNHGVLVEAMAALPDNVKLFIAGDGPLRGELLRKATELGIDDRVRLLGFRSDIPALLNACDLFCMPSLREGLPVSLIEALATGTPCLASGARGCADVLGELANEYIVKGGSSKLWSEAIGKIIVNDCVYHADVASSERSRFFVLDRAVFSTSTIYESMFETMA